MRLNLTSRLAVPMLAIALVAMGCSSYGGSGSVAPPGAISVVATTTFLADLVRQAGAGRVEVSSIVPKGGEVHTYDPSPSDAARLADAKLIVANGLGLDEWLTQLVTDAGATAPIVKLGEGFPDEVYLAGEEGEGGPVNPHLWLDPDLAAEYVARIADGLADEDPEGSQAYRDAAAEAAARFAELKASGVARFAALRPESRRIVSFHDALPYFARAFGLEIVGVIVDAPGQEPSAGEIAALIDEIRRTGVPAIVTEVQFNDELARAIAAETGAAIVSDMYTDTLGDPPIDTYDGMIRWDVERLANALGGL